MRFYFLLICCISCLTLDAFGQDCDPQIHINDLRQTLKKRSIVGEFGLDFQNGKKQKLSFTFEIEKANMTTIFVNFTSKYGNRGLIVNAYYKQKGGDNLQILYGELARRFHQNRIHFVAPYPGLCEIEFKYHKDLIKSYCGGAILFRD